MFSSLQITELTDQDIAEHEKYLYDLQVTAKECNNLSYYTDMVVRFIQMYDKKTEE